MNQSISSGKVKNPHDHSHRNWNYGLPSVGSRIFDAVNVTIMFLLMLVTVYPFLYVLFASMSDPLKLYSHTGLLLAPKGFSLRGYQYVLNYRSIWNGYLVTLFLSTVGTACTLVSSLLFAYVLSKKDSMLHSFFTFTAIFTMYFNGGMIPTYLIVKEVGLLNSLWALIIPGLISTYYVIILRTAIMGVPKEMTESAELDGANEFIVLVRILLPLIVPTIAAIGLFIVVGYWNSWTSALLYIQDTKKMPLQMVLRQILVNNDMSAAAGTGASNRSGEDSATRLLLKYATIIVSTVPIICVYPFLQKHFTKGIMIGALKG
ncbi:MAG: carbohydrate ABC transporter permease [Clostridia bacterium]|nr:carbohydrate ABC transporter permease [Clostridia bacterium]